MFAHKRTVLAKQEERQSRIEELNEYNNALTAPEKRILGLPVSEAVALVNKGELKPRSVLLAYGKQAFNAQAICNPLTEVMIKDAEKWATKTEGPLAGIPVSLKDTVGVAGYDCTVGYSKNAFNPVQESEESPIVRLIRDAGGYPYVKTNIPLTLLSFESYNDLWGTTDNPHVSGYTPGGSSGGEGALIAFGGSRIGVGTDVAGSVRVPAHFSGIYALRPTSARFPRTGGRSSMPGQEGIPSVAGPMARSLGDLSYFFKAVIDMKPWNYEYAVTELPWREANLPKKLKFGVIHSDGIVDPSPACKRALDETVRALEKQGHECVNFEIPDSFEALSVGSQLLCSDGIETATQGLFWGEHNDAGVARAKRWAHLPWIIRKLWVLVVKYWYKDPLWADLLNTFRKVSINERWALVARREAYRAKFYAAYLKSGVDFLITVPNATPALPHKGLYNSFSSCLYSFLFNIVDYPGGVLPVTKVDKTRDALPADFSLKTLNGVAQGAYLNYDATKMHGLPVGVQVVGRRFHEEDVLSAMAVVERALHSSGIKYQQLAI